MKAGTFQNDRTPNIFARVQFRCGDIVTIKKGLIDSFVVVLNNTSKSQISSVCKYYYI